MIDICVADRRTPGLKLDRGECGNKYVHLLKNKETGPALKTNMFAAWPFATKSLYYQMQVYK